MPKRSTKSEETRAQYYDRRGVLKELEEGAVEFTLEEELGAEILKGQRKRRLEDGSRGKDRFPMMTVKGRVDATW